MVQQTLPQGCRQVIAFDKTLAVSAALVLIVAQAACSSRPARQLSRQGSALPPRLTEPAPLAASASLAASADRRRAGEPAGAASAVPAEDEPAGAPAPAPGQADASPEAPLQPAFSQPVVKRHETRAMVLMYHSIDLGETDRSVWPPHLEAQILRMRRERTEIIPMSRFMDFLEGKIRLPRHVAVITIDDGERLFLKHGYPIFLKHRVPFTLGIVTGAVERSARSGALSWDELRALLGTGLCEIANHSHLHRRMLSMKAVELQTEIFHSRDLIAKHLGVAPLVFFYPLGSFNPTVVEHLELAGYRGAFTVVGNTVTADDVHRYAIPRYQVDHRTALQAMTIWLNWNRWPAAPPDLSAGGQ